MDNPNSGQSNLNGSSRPFTGTTKDINQQLVTIYIQTDYVELNGDLCEYFTELTFKKIKSW